MPNTYSVTIAGVAYNSYADLATADTYLNASAQADAWRAEGNPDVKGRYLVSATRLFDRQPWLDIYNTFDLRKVVGDIVNACCEMASALQNGSEAENEQTTTQKFASLRAGSAELTYFRGADGAPLRFPLIVQELLRPYLSSSAAADISAFVSGVDGTSVTDEDFGLIQGL